MRTIRYSPLWERCAAELLPLAPRLEEVAAGVEWAVAADADSYGDPIPGLSMRVALTDPFPGAPAMVWYFSIEDADYAVMEWCELDAEWAAREAKEAEEDEGDG